MAGRIKIADKKGSLLEALTKKKCIFSASKIRHRDAQNTCKGAFHPTDASYKINGK